MMTTFDPSIAENYSRIFDTPNRIKQSDLRFSEPVHYTSENVTIKSTAQPVQKPTVKQRKLSFSEPLHYA